MEPEGVVSYADVTVLEPGASTRSKSVEPELKCSRGLSSTPFHCLNGSLMVLGNQVCLEEPEPRFHLLDPPGFKVVSLVGRQTMTVRKTTNVVAFDCRERPQVGPTPDPLDGQFVIACFQIVPDGVRHRVEVGCGRGFGQGAHSGPGDPSRVSGIDRRRGIMGRSSSKPEPRPRHYPVGSNRPW